MNDSEQILDGILGELARRIHVNANNIVMGKIVGEDDAERHQNSIKVRDRIIEKSRAAILQHYISKEEVEGAITEENLSDLFYDEGATKADPCKVCGDLLYSHSCDSAIYAISKHLRKNLGLDEKK